MDSFGEVVRTGSLLAIMLLIGFSVLGVLGKAVIDYTLKHELARLSDVQDEKIRGVEAALDLFRDRGARLQQHEFEVLPEMWDRLSLAVSEALRVCGPSQRYPSIAAMGAGELDDLLSGSTLREWQIGELKAADGRLRDTRLAEMLKWQRLQEAERLHGDFENYLISKGVFVQADLLAQVRGLSELAYNALAERRRGLALEEASVEHAEAFLAAGPIEMHRIGEAVRARLWEAEKASERVVVERRRRSTAVRRERRGS